MNMRRLIAVLLLILCLISSVSMANEQDGEYVGKEMSNNLMQDENDNILGEGGLVKEVDSFKGFIVVALVVGVVASGYVLYKKSV